MKSLLILFIIIISSFNISGQIELISLEFDSIRALTELNTSQAGEGYPWISNDGLRIYYTSGMSGTDFRILYSQRNSTDDFFSDPIPLSINISSVGSISQWLSEDELHIYFFTRDSNGPQSKTLFHATRDNISDEFNEPIKVDLLGGIEGIINNPSLTRDFNQLFIFNTPSSDEMPGIKILERTGENEYTLVDNIEVPSGYESGQGQISKDGLRFILGLKSETEIFKNLYIIERESETDTFDDFYLIDNDLINSSDLTSIQPSISKNDHYFVFVRNNANMWTRNDLYIAYNFGPVSTNDYNFQDKNSVKVSPNPASEFINFDLENVDCISSDMEIIVFSADGRLIGNKLLSKTNTKISLSTSHYNSGLYFYKIQCENGILTTGSFVVEK